MNDCTTCTELAPTVRRLPAGASIDCPACGAVLDKMPRAARVKRVPRAPDSTARALDTMLRDAAVLASWLTRSSARAIDLDPEARRAGESEPGVAETVRSEQRARRGHTLERVQMRLSPESRAVLRWVAERGGDARTSVVRIGAQVVTYSLADAYARDCAGEAQRAVWKAAGQLDSLARTWGEGQLARAALEWAEAKQAERAEEAVFQGDGENRMQAG